MFASSTRTVDIIISVISIISIIITIIIIIAAMFIIFIIIIIVVMSGGGLPGARPSPCDASGPCAAVVSRM